ncbi:MAG: hypothetical protein WB797_12500 [Nocardioides sp.]
MTWHTEVVASDLFQARLGAIRQAGGTIIASCPCPAGYSVTYATVDR